MLNMKETMQTIREGASGWIDEHGVSKQDAEQLFMYIDEALNTKAQEEKYKQESYMGFHAGERVRLVKRLTSVGAGGHFKDLPTNVQKVGTLRDNPYGQTDFDISDFFLDFDDGTSTRVLIGEIEHA